MLVPTVVSALLLLLQPTSALVNPIKSPFDSVSRPRSASSVMTRAIVSRSANSTTLRDPNTLSNYDKFVTRHTTTNFTIDFAKSQLKGTVQLTLERLASSDEVVLDTSFLKINGLKVDGKESGWNLAERTEPFGSPLTIKVGAGDVGTKLDLVVS